MLFGSHIVLPAKCHGGEYGGVVTVAREPRDGANPLFTTVASLQAGSSVACVAGVIGEGEGERSLAPLPLPRLRRPRRLALPLKMARGRHKGLVTSQERHFLSLARPNPTLFDRAIKQNNCPNEPPVCRLHRS